MASSSGVLRLAWGASLGFTRPAGRKERRSTSASARLISSRRSIHRLAWGPSLTFDMRDRWAAFPKRWAAMRNFVFASESNCDAGPGRGLRPQLPAAAHDVLVAGEL